MVEMAFFVRLIRSYTKETLIIYHFGGYDVL